ncbi:hypothetical protein Y032_0004g2119 [Ancylostoma ceylanicum]|nr:hypothetical protein Y032_0004g2119 [Ancylostoma ceylanicum]
MTEVQILLIRIEELELANRKAGLQMKRLRKELRKKEKKIEELSSIVAFLQKSAAKEEEHDEKATPAEEAIAIRGLEIIKRNQLLEQTVRNAERIMLCNFFEATDPKPNQTIVAVIDKAFSYAIDVLLMRPDLFDDFVDNELRLFLLDVQKAKHVLLDVMLSHPEYVPRAWGGDSLTKRQKEEQLEEERKRNAAMIIEDKTIVEDERWGNDPDSSIISSVNVNPTRKLKEPTCNEFKRSKQEQKPLKSASSKSEGTDKSDQKKTSPEKKPEKPATKKMVQDTKVRTIGSKEGAERKKVDQKSMDMKTAMEKPAERSNQKTQRSLILPVQRKEAAPPVRSSADQQVCFRITPLKFTAQNNAHSRYSYWMCVIVTEKGAIDVVRVDTGGRDGWTECANQSRLVTPLFPS